MAKRNNPLDRMESIDALDLLSEALRLLRLKLPASPAFLDRLREQILRHKRGLRNIIGSEAV